MLWLMQTPDLSLRTLRGSTPSSVVARAIGVARPTWDGWENGRRLPSVVQVAKIARHFELGVREVGVLVLGLAVRT